MNSIDLFNSINEIDDDLIVAANIPRTHNIKKMQIFIPMAAAFIICICTGLLLIQQNSQRIMGNNPQISISEKQDIKCIGLGFSQLEIQEFLENNREIIFSVVCDEYDLIDEAIFIYTKGYRHVICGSENTINLDTLTLPILVNTEIVANIELIKSDNEIAYTTNIGGEKWKNYNDVLKNNPSSDIAFAFYGNTGSEVLILPNNSVIPITHNANINFKEQLEWYSLLQTEYNTLSFSDLNDSKNLFILK